MPPDDLPAADSATVDNAAARVSFARPPLSRVSVLICGQKDALEAALGQQPLTASLGILARTAVDVYGDGLRVAFYLAGDEDGMHHVVGMSPAYATEVEGFPISPDAIACKLAIDTGAPILTTDVHEDPLWAPWRDMADRFAYRGCWSFPIHSQGRAFVGALTFYWPEPRAATPDDVAVADLLTHTGAIIIVTEKEARRRQAAEDAVRASDARQRVLVGELQHGSRNILTVVRSVFTRTLESGGDLESLSDHFRGRLDALARTQVIVTRDPSGQADLEELIRDELVSVGIRDDDAVKVEGPDVSLSGAAAESIGLAIHELTTNALKYGALNAPGGKLTISWSVNVDYSDRRLLNLLWVEEGVPAVSLKPAREGFGRELIERALPYRLNAQTQLEFRGGGVRCSISLPL